MSTRQTGTATLVVDNFSQLNSKRRTEFTFAGLSYFGIYPEIDISTLTQNNVFVFWLNNNEIRANVHFKVSILGEYSEKLYTLEYNWQFDSFNDRPVKAFISRPKLLDPKNGYLVNDKLTLLCEAEIMEQVDQDLNNLSENFQSLLIDDKYSDATLTVGPDEKQFRVHKVILSSRSPVFAAMFEHDCEEKRQNNVKITDIDPETCVELLRYIYTGKVKQLDRYGLELLQAADKYQCDSLKNICEDFLCRTLSIELAANALFVADLDGATKLKNKCIGYICANVDQVKDTDGWKLLDKNPKLFRDLSFYSANKNNK